MRGSAATPCAYADASDFTVGAAPRRTVSANHKLLMQRYQPKWIAAHVGKIAASDAAGQRRSPPTQE
ncbi:hypothetical protein [Caldilinea sp.]|uniref:hypothetical protein n=1 Tax=Caldilinea sp. TaxID=2293560 RepID=UPI00260FA661|nr:hypothetical protein [uncultured Caldilinea sp.]